MKSAYELAMERLDRESPNENTPLTEEQKRELADIDRIYDAKVAERELFLQGKLKGADPKEISMIREQVRLEREKLNAEREAKKNRVRGSA